MSVAQIVRNVFRFMSNASRSISSFVRGYRRTPQSWRGRHGWPETVVTIHGAQNMTQRVKYVEHNYYLHASRTLRVIALRRERYGD